MNSLLCFFRQTTKKLFLYIRRSLRDGFFCFVLFFSFERMALIYLFFSVNHVAGYAALSRRWRKRFNWPFSFTRIQFDNGHMDFIIMCYDSSVDFVFKTVLIHVLVRFISFKLLYMRRLINNQNAIISSRFLFFFSFL